MNYDRPELLDRLASEYAFGTLTGRARRRFERLRRALPAADVAARTWEARLAPLSQPVPPAQPSSSVWDAIDRRTGGGPAATRGERGWRGWFAPALGFAFGILATVGVIRLYPSTVIPFDDIVQQRGTLPASYVGLLTDADGAPTVLASSTRHGRTMTFKFLKPVAPPPGKRLVLWALPKDGAPFALGAIPPPDGNRSVLTMSGTSEQLLSNVPRLAVSFEDAVPANRVTPSPFVLSGHCVKLW